MRKIGGCCVAEKDGCVAEEDDEEEMGKIRV